MARCFSFARTYHITSCIYCGWREATTGNQAYAFRCPNDGGSLEHFVTAIDDPDELRDIRRDGQDSRRPTHSYSVRRVA